MSTATAMRAEILDDVLDGLLRTERQLPPKLFYDRRGSELFDRICELPEYYVTRTECGILKDHATEITRHFGEGCALVELGAGSLRKVRLLLDAAQRPGVYVPVDVSSEHLQHCAETLSRDYPDLRIVPVCGDFTKPLRLDQHLRGHSGRRVGFFPGSTIGNFDPAGAENLLRTFAEELGPDSALVVGVDLVKDTTTLEAAYNDREGTTAEFNLNVLHRINRELDAGLDTAAFRHEAVFNRRLSRIEMWLHCQRPQRALIGGHEVDFRAGDSIHTESSYKYTIDAFHSLASRAGFIPAQTWTDKRELFSVHLLKR